VATARGQPHDPEALGVGPDDVERLGADRARRAEDDDVAAGAHGPILPDQAPARRIHAFEGTSARGISGVVRDRLAIVSVVTQTTGGPDLPQERRLVTEVPGPRSREKFERRSRYVAQGVGTTLPVFVEAAGGGVLVDADGNSLIDLTSGIAVATVGNSAPRVVERVIEQTKAFTHTCFMVTPYDVYVDVAERLSELTPGDHEKKSALLNSGAEAVENAVKVARAFTGRSAVAVVDHAYHGRTNLTMAMTAKSMPYKHGFGPFAGEIYRAPMSYPFREPTEITGAAAADRAIDVLEKQVGAANLSCLVIEPILGEGGFVVPADGFLPRLREWTEQNGIVFVADEIQSGFCRTGDWFACDHEGVVPDLITTAKGIAGGFPLAAVTGRADIMDAVHVGGLGGTFGGNPLSCAAGLVSLDQVEDPAFLARAREIGEIVTSELTSMQERHALIGDVRGMGPMIGVELVTDRVSKEPAAEQAGRVVALARERGLMLMGAGIYSNVVRILVPLVVGDEDLRAGLDILDGCLADA
jgi:4-aminobutyrate aminotransferase/(S)-3-amino-2-methylpropionate transaminase